MKKLKRSIPEEPVKLRIRKGDTVLVIAGKDKGKKGQILSASPKKNQVMVEGCNIVVKHSKERGSRKINQTGQPDMIPGGRIEKEAPLHAAKVMMLCPHCSLPTRVGYAYKEGEEKLSRRKYRVCKHPGCGKNMDSV